MAGREPLAHSLFQESELYVIAGIQVTYLASPPRFFPSWEAFEINDLEKGEGARSSWAAASRPGRGNRDGLPKLGILENQGLTKSPKFSRMDLLSERGFAD